MLSFYFLKPEKQYIRPPLSSCNLINPTKHRPSEHEAEKETNIQMYSFFFHGKCYYHVQIVQSSACECERRRSMCFSMSQLSHCIMSVVLCKKKNKKKKQSHQQGKIDVKHLFFLRFQKVSLMSVGLLAAAAACARVCMCLFL